MVADRRVEAMGGALRPAPRHRACAALPKRSAMAHGDAGARLGWQLVSTRVFRRWDAPWLGAERGVPNRLADAVVGRHVGGRRPAADGPRDRSRTRPSGAPRRAGRAAVDAPV